MFNSFFTIANFANVADRKAYMNGVDYDVVRSVPLTPPPFTVYSGNRMTARAIFGE